MPMSMYNEIKKRLLADPQPAITATEVSERHRRALEEYKNSISYMDDAVQSAHWSVIRNGIGMAAAPAIPSPAELAAMIDMRLRTPKGQFRFQFMMPFKVPNEDRVVVFIVQNGQVTHLEDDWNLFPSDTLITQLRLLL